MLAAWPCAGRSCFPMGRPKEDRPRAQSGPHPLPGKCVQPTSGGSLQEHLRLPTHMPSAALPRVPGSDPE